MFAWMRTSVAASCLLIIVRLVKFHFSKEFNEIQLFVS